MFKKLFKDKKGSAVVEVALTIPIFLLLVFGYIFFMHGIEEKLIMRVAAREGARVYANPIVGEDMRVLAIAKAEEELANNNVSATIEAYADGDMRIVKIEKPYSTRFPMKNFTLKAGAAFHIEPYNR
ncbi:hypothetical protein DW1_2090 [Proteiniborus sp. DW1]|uniref:TadE/TadG family type IV pilus assembly protein n=1 Tax=Proteiniborus sp. DW1 TaxID=1889883 RepID=UPI00092E1BF8|nr:TadE family protein [Proteiniborus sp. DW1]SCG83656.1 hypothetical protein DW1_2090 [Proteiniborus sp. DW1]